jgi:hypothetical protein
MSATQSVDPPAGAVSIAKQYYRRSRILTYLIAIVVVGFVGLSFFLLPFFGWILFAGIIFVMFRFPLFVTGGQMTLETDKAPHTVRAEFESSTPPILPFYWGLADQIESTDGGGRYVINYLGGLQSVELTIDCQPTPDDAADFQLVVTAADSPWGSYQVNVDETSGADGPTRTTVNIDSEADRQFGLRRLPQQLMANNYRPTAIETQGYDIVEFESSISTRW